MLIWYVTGAVAAVAIGGIAAELNGAGWAPVVILPIGVGAALGAIVAALAAHTGDTSRKRLIAGTVLLALVAVIAEHAWLYRDFRRQWREDRVNEPRVALFRAEPPWSPGEYFMHELNAGSGPMWCLDGVLIVVGAVATVFVMHRQREVIGSPRRVTCAADAKPPDSRPQTPAL